MSHLVNHVRNSRKIVILNASFISGLPIQRIEIGKLNFLTDSAKINIYYDADAHRANNIHFEASSISRIIRIQ